MYKQSPRDFDRLISRYGVRFVPQQNGTEAPTLYRLHLDDEGNAQWEQVVTAVATTFNTEGDRIAVANGILSNYVKSFTRTKEPALKVGDKVYHPKHKWSGKLVQINGDDAVVDLGFLQTQVPLKELRKDRNQ